MTFNQWYKAANEACIRLSGVGIDDLADGPSRSCYNSGMSPEEYATQQLEEEGFPFED